MDQALRRSWAGGSARSDAHAAQFPACNIGRDRERDSRATEALPVLGSEEAQGAAGAHEPEREVAGGEHGGSDPQPGRAHQPEEEETARHAKFATVLDGYGAQSALVHGFQRLLPYWRWVSLPRTADF
jgi:hypothetical protein